VLLVVGRVVAAEHRRLLAQDQFAAGDDVVIDRGRGDEGAEADAHEGLVPLGVAADARGEQLLTEVDLPGFGQPVRGVIVEQDHRDTSNGVASVGDDELPSEHVDVLQAHVVAVLDEHGPLVVGPGCGHRHQLEVERVLVVQQEEHVLAGESGVLKRVLDAGFSGPHHPELALRIVRLEDSHLAGHLR
jgi:hypothetical protein